MDISEKLKSFVLKRSKLRRVNEIKIQDKNTLHKNLPCLFYRRIKLLYKPFLIFIILIEFNFVLDSYKVNKRFPIFLVVKENKILSKMPT